MDRHADPGRKAADKLTQRREVHSNVLRQLLAAVLHDETGVRQRDDFLEPMLFVVEPQQKRKVFSFPNAIATRSLHAQVDERRNT